MYVQDLPRIRLTIVYGIFFGNIGMGLLDGGELLSNQYGMSTVEPFKQ